MDGKLSTFLWKMAAIAFAAAIAVFAFAYSAGSNSGGLSLLDFGALARNSGLYLLAGIASLFVIAGVLSWAAWHVMRRVATLRGFSQTLATGDPNFTADMLTFEDDFGAAAADLNFAAQRFAAIATAQSDLDSLVAAISDLRRELDSALAGDPGASADTKNKYLAELAISLNALLARVAQAEEQQAIVTAAAHALRRATEPLQERMLRLKAEVVEGHQNLQQLNEILQKLEPLTDKPEPERSLASVVAAATPSKREPELVVLR